MLFRTKNTVYNLDTKNKTVSVVAGKNDFLGDRAVPFVNANCIVGTPGIIELSSGAIIKTSTIQEYVGL